MAALSRSAEPGSQTRRQGTRRGRKNAPRAAGVAAIAIALAGGTVGQGPSQEAHLAPALGPGVGDFTRIIAVRELADGTVLVLQQERVWPLVRLDFRGRRQTPIVRRGAGPGELYSTVRLLPLAGDSTLVPDGAQRRWLILVGHRVVETVTFNPFPDLGRLVGHLIGADHLGHVLAVQPITEDGAPALPWMADSVLVIRWNRVTASLDTLLRAKAGHKGAYVGKQETAVGELNVIAANPLSVNEQAIQFADGWIAVARFDPYRVTWVHADGRRTTGPPISADMFAVDEREKRAALERSLGRLPGLRNNPAAFNDWPVEYPPFDRDALFATPEGWLLIHRMINSRSQSERYHVIDRSGRLLRTLTLPLRHRIVGFGRYVVYVAAKDADDVEHLERHPWP